MYDEKPEITKAADTIYAITAEMARGDILTHEQIREVLQVPPHTGIWGHVMNKVRRRLQADRGIATWPEKTVGYKLLTQTEQLQLPEWRMKRGLRQVKRGRKSLNALPEKGLTVNQRRARVFMLERLKDTEHAIRRSIKDQQNVRPTPTIPRRPALV